MERLPNTEHEPRLNEAQEASLRQLCDRYEVEYQADHYTVWPEDSFIMPGYAEGWIGGPDHAKDCGTGAVTIYVGVSPTGEVSS